MGDKFLKIFSHSTVDVSARTYQYIELEYISHTNQNHKRWLLKFVPHAPITIAADHYPYIVLAKRPMILLRVQCQPIPRNVLQPLAFQLRHHVITLNGESLPTRLVIASLL
jgi:hypothetical protein